MMDDERQQRLREALQFARDEMATERLARETVAQQRHDAVLGAIEQLPTPAAIADAVVARLPQPERVQNDVNRFAWRIAQDAAELLYRDVLGWTAETAIAAAVARTAPALVLEPVIRRSAAMLAAGAERVTTELEVEVINEVTDWRIRARPGYRITSVNGQRVDGDACDVIVRPAQAAT
jgi:hypothetical protein